MRGYSLSLCVADIIAGKVPLQAVESIQASTRARTDRDWHVLVEGYCIHCWRKDPRQARDAVSHLRRLGRITQPRLEDPDYFRPLAPGGHWA